MVRRLLSLVLVPPAGVIAEGVYARLPVVAHRSTSRPATRPRRARSARRGRVPLSRKRLERSVAPDNPNRPDGADRYTTTSITRAVGRTRYAWSVVQVRDGSRPSTPALSPVICRRPTPVAILGGTCLRQAPPDAVSRLFCQSTCQSTAPSKAATPDQASSSALMATPQMRLLELPTLRLMNTL